MATTLTSQEFDEDIGRAKSAASRGPVFVTEDGRLAYVLLSVDHYQGLTSGGLTLAEALAQPGAEFEFDPARLGSTIFKPADLL